MGNNSRYTIDKITGPAPKPYTIVMVTAGLLMVVAGVLMPIVNHAFTLGLNEEFKWVYSAGALIVLAGRILSPYKGKVLRIKRLARIESWSAIFFCVAAFFMFYPSGTLRDWLAFTLAGGAIQIYTSLMLPWTMKKAQKETK